MYKVDNAIIMAAGTASRFAPLSFEMPKALIEVRGEVLIERQIRQLREAGIKDIVLVVGYMKERFQYLKDKFGLTIIENPDYLSRNNNASIYHARKYLRNTLICSADNYFLGNPFATEYEDSYYSALYSEGYTNEWCMEEDENGYISKVAIGGKASWYMLGHVFWNEEFSRKFLEILLKEYDLPETKGKLWERIFMDHLDVLKMKIKRYPKDFIFEFDTLDELRLFDESYVFDTRSSILKEIAGRLGCLESDIANISPLKETSNEASGFAFESKGAEYKYTYGDKSLRRR